MLTLMNAYIDSVSAKQKQRMFDQNFPDEIIPGLYLGNTYARTPYILDNLGIRNIVTANGEPLLRDSSKYHNIGVRWFDTPDQIILPEIIDLVDFIDNKLQQKQKVLVHCTAGISRSASVVILYLMIHYNLTYDDAYTYVKSKRPIIEPNPGFVYQLRQFQDYMQHNNGP